LIQKEIKFIFPKAGTMPAFLNPKALSRIKKTPRPLKSLQNAKTSKFRFLEANLYLSTTRSKLPKANALIEFY